MAKNKHLKINHALHLACEKDGIRPEFQKVYFWNQKAYATNSHIAIRIPMGEVFGGPELEEMATCHSMHSSAFRAIYRKPYFVKEGGLYFSPSVSVDALFKVPLAEESEDDDRFLPKKIDAIFALQEAEEGVIEPFNVYTTSLTTLFKALGLSTLQIQNKPHCLILSNQDEMIGLIMKAIIYP